MPTYEYVCKNCGHQFEKFQSITANSLRKCPKCGKMKLQRLIGGGAGIIFKGAGFYETDYRSESYKAGEKKAKEQPKKSTCDSCKETKCDKKKTNTDTKSAPAKDKKKTA